MRRVSAEEALLPYRPSKQEPFDAVRASHLARRAAFGASAKERAWMLENGLEASLTALLEPQEDGGRFEELFKQLEGQVFDQSRADGLQTMWLYRMLHSQEPLRERMTLFWHGHFATSIRKVYRGALMLRQNELLRRHALGKFGDLLRGISRDPAMLIWLDNRVNDKRKPNENYARELLELFSLGRDRYTEKDIQEVARAFTGWQLRGSEFRFNESRHDAGEKTIFGKRGKFGGDDVIRLILAQDACAEFVTGKIWREFVGDWLPRKLHLELARGFRESDYDLRALLRRVLSSRGFFSEQAWRARIASPAEVVVGQLRRLGARVQLGQASRAISSMGQQLFAPPTVEGWKGGREWLSARWNIARMNSAGALAAMRGSRGESRFDAGRYVREHELRTAPAVVDHFLLLFVDGKVSADVRKRLLYFMEHDDLRGRRKPGQKGKDRKVPFKLDYHGIDGKVRGLVSMILSLPEAQVC